eukprot:NODE_1641_length_1269_cov_54.589317_g1626_i0.p1 GENE.NODE_1641_length_1269_cov_54.589317_g1626_i0~~NODE_1641_length_1269_cov_54.589317_g1626_i0.p1  ORF type:complete len:282 (-),score=17.37 NODE_1641_length_1269_cov_54.589317_g1626_i0:23-868(-)
MPRQPGSPQPAFGVDRSTPPHSKKWFGRFMDRVSSSKTRRTASPVDCATRSVTTMEATAESTTAPNSASSTLHVPHVPSSADNFAPRAHCARRRSSSAPSGPGAPFPASAPCPWQPRSPDGRDRRFAPVLWPSIRPDALLTDRTVRPEEFPLDGIGRGGLSWEEMRSIPIQAQTCIARLDVNIDDRLFGASDPCHGLSFDELDHLESAGELWRFKPNAMPESISLLSVGHAHYLGARIPDSATDASLDEIANREYYLERVACSSPPPPFSSPPSPRSPSAV